MSRPFLRPHRYRLTALPSDSIVLVMKATTTKLTAAQKRRVRELMEDEGQTRAEAVAWVLAFEPEGK